MPVSPADYRTLAQFRATLRRFLRISEELAHGVGLTPQQHQALLAIMGFAGDGLPSMGDLAARLQIRHNSVVGLVDRLVKRKLVRRQTAKEDRRRVRLQLTHSGERLLAQLTRAHQIELREIGPQITQLLQRLEK
ncbi:MAG: MarR family winged helix-turn-helix transcriptional regulator [Gammaproteobacteria bacterium]